MDRLQVTFELLDEREHMRKIRRKDRQVSRTDKSASKDGTHPLGPRACDSRRTGSLSLSHTLCFISVGGF